MLIKLWKLLNLYKDARRHNYRQHSLHAVSFCCQGFKSAQQSLKILSFLPFFQANELVVLPRDLLKFVIYYKSSFS